MSDEKNSKLLSDIEKIVDEINQYYAGDVKIDDHEKTLHETVYGGLSAPESTITIYQQTYQERKKLFGGVRMIPEHRIMLFAVRRRESGQLPVLIIKDIGENAKEKIIAGFKHRDAKITYQHRETKHAPVLNT